MYGKFIKKREFFNSHIIVEGSTINEIKEKYDSMYKNREDFVVLNSHQEELLFNLEDGDDKYHEVVIYHNNGKEYKYLNENDFSDLGF